MLTITLYGAADQVTGSNTLVDIDGERILVDCGAFQGGRDLSARNGEPFAYDPASIDAVVLTHAHLDHCGRLPFLVKSGFKGKIYATGATRDLALIVMRDAATIAAHDHLGDGVAVYSVDDVEKCGQHFVPLPYNTITNLTRHVDVQLVDAGHILGSSSVILHVGNQRIVFSGDLGNPGAAIIRDPTLITSADVVVTEATYGDRGHTHPPHRTDEFVKFVEQSITKGGTVLIPAFSIERTQELLYAFAAHQTDRAIANIPIFLDSPMAIAATEVFKDYPEDYDQEAAALHDHGREFFRFPNLHVTRTIEASKAIAHAPNPKIIVAGSGMMTGGRIRYHLRNYLNDPATTLLIVGYQAQGTLGRQIQEGMKTVRIMGERISVRAKVVSIDYLSAHADQEQLLRWLKIMQGLKYAIVNHSDPDVRPKFAARIQSELGIQALTPKEGQPVRIKSIGQTPLTVPTVIEPDLETTPVQTAAPVHS